MVLWGLKVIVIDRQDFKRMPNCSQFRGDCAAQTVKGGGKRLELIEVPQFGWNRACKRVLVKLFEERVDRENE